MRALIRSIHAELKGAYGSPRMVRELRARGFSACKERAERLMRENGIHARQKRRYKVTTDSKHGLPVAEPARQKLHTDGAEPGLDVGHYRKRSINHGLPGCEADTVSRMILHV